MTSAACALTLEDATRGVESRLRCLRSRAHVASPRFTPKPVLRSPRGKAARRVDRSSWEMAALCLTVNAGNPPLGKGAADLRGLHQPEGAGQAPRRSRCGRLTPRDGPALRGAQPRVARAPARSGRRLPRPSRRLGSGGTGRERWRGDGRLLADATLPGSQAVFEVESETQLSA